MKKVSILNLTDLLDQRGMNVFEVIGLAACDFSIPELLEGTKSVRYIVISVIELAIRKIFFTPIKPQQDGPHMRQVAGLLTDSDQRILSGKRYLIYDRDSLSN